MGLNDGPMNWGVIQPHDVRLISEDVRAKFAWLSQMQCASCGHPVARGADDLYDKMHDGHVVAWSRGGPDSWSNLVCLCARCNWKQGDRSALEAFGVMGAFRINAQALVNGIVGRCFSLIFAAGRTTRQSSSL